VRTGTILKIYNTLVLPTFLYGSENWTLTALRRRRIEATNDYIRSEQRITGILDKLDEYRRNWLSHLQRMPQNGIPLKSYHYRPRGRRTVWRPKNQALARSAVTLETERIKGSDPWCLWLLLLLSSLSLLLFLLLLERRHKLDAVFVYYFFPVF